MVLLDKAIQSRKRNQTKGEPIIIIIIIMETNNNNNNMDTYNNMDTHKLLWDFDIHRNHLISAR